MRRLERIVGCSLAIIALLAIVGGIDGWTCAHPLGTLALITWVGDALTIRLGWC
jgi:hypothetical protein